MGYHIRAFCTANEVPSIAGLLEWLGKRQIHTEIQDGPPSANLESRQWKQVSLAYKSGKEPLVLKLETDNGTKDSPLRKTIDTFLEQVGPAGKSQAKQRVVTHLKATRFIVTCELPAQDMDNEGWDANGQILTFLGEYHGALVQADREGFYDGDKLILQLK